MPSMRRPRAVGAASSLERHNVPLPGPPIQQEDMVFHRMTSTYGRRHLASRKTRCEWKMCDSPQKQTCSVVRHATGKGWHRRRATVRQSSGSFATCRLPCYLRKVLLVMFRMGSLMAQATPGANAGHNGGISLDFIVAGAHHALGELTVTSVFVDGNGNKENNKEGRGNSYVVHHNGARRAKTGVHDGDFLVAVAGHSLAGEPLSEWIQGITSSPNYSSRKTTAVFPLVDVDESSTDASNRTTIDTLTISRKPCTTEFSDASCTIGAQASQKASADSAGSGKGDKTQRGSGTRTAFGPGFPLKGFLRVEYVDLADANVTFRPGEVRREALIREPAEESSAEQQERQRLVAEAKASLDFKKKAEEEARLKSEAAAKAEAVAKAREKAKNAKAAEAKRKEDARLRREEEAAAKASQKSKADVATMRKEGKSFMFTAEYKEVAPMGLTFDLANPLAVVSEVVGGGMSDRAGVHVGDHLVRVNDRDTSEMKPTAAIKLLQRADWPRALMFATPEKEREEAQDGSALLELAVTEPEIVRGEYLMQAPKDWGRRVGESVEGGGWSCEPRPVVLSDPPPACQRDVRLDREIAPGQQSAIVLVKRGVCTFVEKAKNVQTAIRGVLGGMTEERDRVSIHGGMVLVNGEDELAGMPAGNLVTDDVTISVAMISQGNGSSIEAVLSWGIDVKAAIVPTGACPLQNAESHKEAEASEKKPRNADVNGGRLLVLSKARGGAEFEYRQALFGPDIFTGDIHAVAVADPFDGCDDKAYKVRVAGMFVTVERGGCSFSMKTLAAQRAGASGVILVNTANITLRVTADPGDGDRARIPTVMVSADAGQFLSTAAGASRNPILARFYREGFDSDRD